VSRTRKRPKRGAKAIDRSCRNCSAWYCNHGTCPWTGKTTLRKLAVLERLEEALGVEIVWHIDSRG
jgi:hypothetical protein